MKLFNQPIIVDISPDLVAKAIDFAKQVVDTVNYTDSNQLNKLKIEQDHFISKIGEEAVKTVFEQFNKNIIGPDYTIYKGKQKTWQEDLIIDEQPMAVKTQKISAAKRYGLSWTFQASPFRTDPILQTPKAWVTFVACDDINDYNCTVYPPFQVDELLFKDPLLPHLKGKKKVVYAVDFAF